MVVQATAQFVEQRIRYALALLLIAVATDASRPALSERWQHTEQALQQLWRDALRKRLQAGKLDADMQVLLADQLKHID